MKKLTPVERAYGERISAVKAEVRDCLVERFGRSGVDSAYVGDITGALAIFRPGIVDHHAGHIAAGQFDDAAKLVGDSLADLNAADELLFAFSPTKAALALLVYMATPPCPMVDRDRLNYSHGVADRVGVVERRRLALRLRRKLIADGLALPTLDAELGPKSPDARGIQYRRARKASSSSAPPRLTPLSQFTRTLPLSVRIAPDDCVPYIEEGGA